MTLRKSLAFLLILVLSLSLVTGCNAGNSAEDPTQAQGSDGAEATPSEEKYSQREKTMYVTGKAWGAPSGFNHLAGWASFPVESGNNALVYEPLFLYNYETDALEPLLGKNYTWTDNYTITVEMQDYATFRDGEEVTAEDVVYSYELGIDYWPPWGGIWSNLESIEATDTYEVTLHLKQDENYNRLSTLESLANVPIHPKHIWEKLEEENDYDPGALAGLFNEDPIGSGPYHITQFDETRIVLERNDDYWGQTLFGGLPKPKYIVHMLFEGNEASSLAFKDQQLDYSENFHADVPGLIESGPIKTYLPEKPYYTNDTLPALYINVNRPGLDNPDVRRALAYAIDYDGISSKAMSGYSSEMEPSLMSKNDNEQALINAEALAGLQWTTDLDKANEILDSIGAERGDDGIRVLSDGTRLGPWKLVCPNGWTDWNATLEIVAQSGKSIGIDLVTEFPEWGVYDENLATGNFDFMMYTPAAYVTPANPWKRIHDVMFSEGVPEIGERAYWNYMRYENEEANEIIKAIPNETDKETLKELYTEINKIYLEEIPVIPLMYRATYFYTFSEAYWKGFPQVDDEAPAYLFNGAGIKGLYTIEHAN